MSDDLVTWLRARLYEDEASAREADPAWHRRIVVELSDQALYGIHKQVRHIAHWDPARVLAEVDAKWRILDQLEMWLRGHDVERAHEFPGTTAGVGALLTAVRTLALPYADRPGYREEWRP